MDLSPSTHDYYDLIKLQKKLSIFMSLSLIWGLFLGSIMLFAFFDQQILAICIGSIVFLLGISASFILNIIFVNNSKKVLFCFFKAYGVPQEFFLINYTTDNYNIIQTVLKGKKSLLCFCTEGKSISFVSATFLNIKKIKWFSKQYNDALNSDFGKLEIKIDSITYYRKEGNTCLIVFKDNELTRRISFNTDKPFAKYISDKEYYFQMTLSKIKTNTICVD